MDLSIIIINYKTKDLTLQTLTSIFKADPPSGKMEVFLIDNHSQDDTPVTVKQQFPQVKQILSSTNLGFAGGNNLGLRQAKGKYVLLLNSDTVIAKDSLVKMIDYMNSNPQVGLATCRVELADGRIDPASHRGFPTPWASLTYYLGLEKFFPHSPLLAQYHQGWKDLKQIHEIDSPVGAFFFLRKSALNQVGLLDEAFFMYAEDLDLAFRIKKSGWQVMYVPLTTITHLKGASGINSTDKSKKIITTKAFFDTMKTFYQKHYRKKYLFFIRWLVFLGIDLVKTIKIIKIRL